MQQSRLFLIQASNNARFQKGLIDGCCCREGIVRVTTAISRGTGTSLWMEGSPSGDLKGAKVRWHAENRRAQSTQLAPAVPPKTFAPGPIRGLETLTQNGFILFEMAAPSTPIMSSCRKPPEKKVSIRTSRFPIRHGSVHAAKRCRLPCWRAMWGKGSKLGIQAKCHGI
jgi:hypothetical protein